METATPARRRPGKPHRGRRPVATFQGLPCAGALGMMGESYRLPVDVTL